MLTHVGINKVVDDDEEKIFCIVVHIISFI